MTKLTDEQLEIEYNEYLEDTDDVRILTWHEFKSRRTVMFGNILKPETKKAVVITKAAIARQIFDAGKLEGLNRKEIIELFIDEAGLTKAGAATYYANFMNSLKTVIKTVNMEVNEVNRLDLEAAAELYDCIVSEVA